MYTSFTDWESGIYLQHHGIRGQKWGVRKFQNSDGTLTAEGRARYGGVEGGSRKMSRQFNRQMRKLNKLQSRADIGQQQANIAKYDKRAKTAMKVGNTAAGVAATTLAGQYGLGNLSRKFDNQIGEATRNSINKQFENNLSYGKTADNLKNLYKEGAISKNLYRQQDANEYGKYIDTQRAIRSQEKAERIAAANKRDIADVARNVTKGVGYAAAATAAVSYGVAAYSKIQSHMAKKRLSEVGHTKAVQNAQAQVAKMEKMFANTPYAELLRKQNRKRS